ncbi:MAG: thiamine phosphate synthase [Lachnospiraceae bacterium]|nr:thiamine phosphate synthase [Lachnospiraceae bacterium]
MTYDYSLYLVTDRMCMSAATLREAVEQAVLGGCTMVQLRENHISSRDFYDTAKEIKEITDTYDIPLIINNRIDIALAVDAAGVHIGQSDIPSSVARKLIGREKLLGVSASSLREALQAQSDGADYLGVGAMFPTKTKYDAKIVSMEEWQAIRQAVTIPIVVIGGIGKENAAVFLQSGADGIAAASAILAQPDIRRAAAELKRERIL